MYTYTQLRATRTACLYLPAFSYMRKASLGCPKVSNCRARNSAAAAFPDVSTKSCAPVRAARRASADSSCCAW